MIYDDKTNDMEDDELEVMASPPSLSNMEDDSKEEEEDLESIYSDNLSIQLQGPLRRTLRIRKIDV
jgi:hypothetical protein